MADFGFRRDIANSRLDIEVAGTDILQMSTTALTLPSGIQFNVSSGKAGFIPIDLHSARGLASGNYPASTGTNNHGGVLGSGTNPILQHVNTLTDPTARISWANTSVLPVKFAPVALPPDCDTSATVEFHALTSMEAATTAAATIDVRVFNSRGDTEMGGNINLTEATGINEQTLSIAAANIAALPTFLNIVLVPAAHSAGADIYLYAAWLEYTIAG